MRESFETLARALGLRHPVELRVVDNEIVAETLQGRVVLANESLARVDQIKKVTILPTDWEPGGDELTPTMKLKRKPSAQKYAEEIEALYSG